MSSDLQSAVSRQGGASRPGAGGRLSRPQLFMEVARLYGRRSSCPRASVGVVAVQAGRIVSAGYAGAPSGQPHCLDVGCRIVDDHCVRSVHAEANMVAWAARTGTSLEGSEIYCTHFPCLSCAKLVGNVGVQRFIYDQPYRIEEDYEYVISVLNVYEFKHMKDAIEPGC